MKQSISLFALLTFLVSQGQSDTLTFELTGMSPHVGQKFEARLVDMADQREVDRVSIPAISAADFDLTLAGLETGGSYFLDFYADFNGNGYYDSPPTDHAWRLEVIDVLGNTTVSFTHNTGFFDIPWLYLFTLNLTDMTPHVGQSFQLRLIESSGQREVGRTKIDTIPAAAFSVSVPGIVMGNDYTVDFFADFNKNGVYDPPSTDHAWRMTFDNAQGNTELSFAHNTDFTDIDWVYLLKLHLSNFSPHLDQLFEARLVDISLGPEDDVSRASVDSIPVADFSVNLPGLVIGQTYVVDFYADFNENGTYDAPPTDHAWRLTLDDVAGDTLLTFEHNTDFTDVEWPGPLAIGSGISEPVPARFSLHQNYPNPFNPVTTLGYDLARKSEVTLIIYDIMGRRVRTLVQKVEDPGSRSVTWNGTDDRGQPVSTGVYLYRIQAGHDFARTRKMVLLQ